MKNQQMGFSLVRCIGFVLIASSLAGVASNLYSSTQDIKQAKNHITLLTHDIYFARQEASKAGRYVYICASHTPYSDCDSNNDWNQGWIIYTSKSKRSKQYSPEREDTLIKKQVIKGIATVNVNQETIAFNRKGFLVKKMAQKVSVCDQNNEMVNGIKILPSGIIKRPYGLKNPCGSQASSSSQTL